MTYPYNEAWGDFGGADFVPPPPIKPPTPAPTAVSTLPVEGTSKRAVYIPGGLFPETDPNTGAFTGKMIELPGRYQFLESDEGAVSPSKAAELGLGYARLGQEGEQFGAKLGLEQSQIAYGYARLDQEAEQAKYRQELDAHKLELEQANAEADQAFKYYSLMQENAYRQGNMQLAQQAQEYARQTQELQLELQAQELELRIGQAEIQRSEVLGRLAANPRDYVQYFNMVRPDLGGTVLDPKGTVVGGQAATPQQILSSAPHVAKTIGLQPEAGQFGVQNVPGVQALGALTPDERGMAESFASAGGVSGANYEELLKKYNPAEQFAPQRAVVTSGG